jgi:nitroreductase
VCRLLYRETCLILGPEDTPGAATLDGRGLGYVFEAQVAGHIAEGRLIRGNSSLQGAYFIIAARALGLDTGPMSGFDNEAVDREFFPGGRIKSNFLCALGHGDPAGLFERLPRPAFSEVCSIV